VRAERSEARTCRFARSAAGRLPQNSRKERTLFSRVCSKRLISLAGGLGFEPRLTESESAVLPLNYPPPHGIGPSAGHRASRVAHIAADPSQAQADVPLAHGTGAAPRRARQSGQPAGPHRRDRAPGRACRPKSLQPRRSFVVGTHPPVVPISGVCAPSFPLSIRLVRSRGNRSPGQTSPCFHGSLAISDDWLVPKCRSDFNWGCWPAAMPDATPKRRVLRYVQLIARSSWGPTLDT
jgi:hypothetical protein